MSTLEIILGFLGSGAVGTLISCVFQYFNKKKDKQIEILMKQKDLEKGMSLLLLSTLKRDGDELKKKGKVSKADYDAFMETYKAYKALGGDGWADGVKAQIEKLDTDLEE